MACFHQKKKFDYQDMDFEFKEVDSRKVVLRGMLNDARKIISAKWIGGYIQTR